MHNIRNIYGSTFSLHSSDFNVLLGFVENFNLDNHLKIQERDSSNI